MIRRFLAPLVAALFLCHGVLAQQQWLPRADWDRLPPGKSGCLARSTSTRPAAAYFTGADSIHRAYPIRMSARDQARFCPLYLHKGAWGEKQIVAAAWVAENTRPYSDAGSARLPLGYGHLWWTAPPSRTRASKARAGSRHWAPAASMAS